MKLEEYLERNKIWHRFVSKTETIHTADAAKAAGVELNKVTKNLVSLANTGEHVLLIVPGNRKVDLKQAASSIGVEGIKLVSFEEAEKISGYPPGGTPSVAHKNRMRVVVEKSLLSYDTVFCGGGSRDRLLELRVQDIVRLNDAIVETITQ